MNKLIPILVVFMLVVLGVVLYISVSDRGEPDAGALPIAGEPTLPTLGATADRDNPTETLRTLTQMQENLQQRLDAQQASAMAAQEKLEQQLTESQTHNQQLRDEIGQMLQQVDRDVDERLAQLPPLKSVSEADRAVAPGGAEGMPPGLGYDASGLGNYPVQPQTPVPDLNIGMPGAISDEYVSVQPVGTGSTPVETTEDTGLIGGLLRDGQQLLQPGGTASPATGQATSTASPNRKVSAVKPAYTINNQASLVANTTMTALLGKVPNSDNVVDPFRFKVITRDQNLAASGLYLPPGVDEIVWSGYAIGNREMACVRGWVDTVTLVFLDGTISTTTTRDNTNNPKSVRSLGYISDPWGKPCINGKLFSNSDQYLKDRGFLAMLGAVADASASAETSTITQNDSFLSAVTGDNGDYIVGKSVAGFADELLQFFRDRMANAFDIIYVGTGEPLTIHVEDEIAFNYDPNGRKTNHGFQLQQVNAAGRLFD